MIGSCRETISRAFNQLARDGLDHPARPLARRDARADREGREEEGRLDARPSELALGLDEPSRSASRRALTPSDSDPAGSAEIVAQASWMHPATMIRRTRVEVDLAAIVGNARAVPRDRRRPTLYAVVKADALRPRRGRGRAARSRRRRPRRASRSAWSRRASRCARPASTAPILVMGPSQHGGEDEMVAANLTPGDRAATRISRALADVGAPARAPIEAHLKVDTGMGRLGVPVERAAELAVEAARDGIRIVGLMTHFACADTDDPADPDSHDAPAARAVRRGRSRASPPPARRCASVTRRTARARCCSPRRASTSCAPASRSTATAAGPTGRRTRRRRCGWSPRSRSCARSRTGASVGYGAAWRAPRDEPRRGAADRLCRWLAAPRERPRRGRDPRHARAARRARQHGHRDRRRHGRSPTSRSAMPAVLLGRASGGASITTAEYGAWAGLSEYEVTCGMSKRVPRTYVGDPP